LKSYEIPIKWTGPGIEPKGAEYSGPSLPGAWDPSPVEEHEEDLVVGAYQGEKTPDKQEADVRIKSPQLVVQQTGARKSEAGLVGVMPEKEKPNKLKRASDGWVMVNVEGQDIPISKGQKQETDFHVGHKRGSASEPAIYARMKTSPPERKPVNESTSRAHLNGTMPPAAKAIAIIDAVSAKEKDREEASSSSQPPAFKRLLSISRKEKDEKSKDKDKGSLRQRWKRLGKSEG
jgi:hypothetical protein